jgi:hypothetical protein
MKIEHPYADLTGGRWLRGNLHAHTDHSDGARPRQAVIDDYASRGYDFLMLSDHDVLTSLGDYEKVNNRGLTLIPGNEVTDSGEHLLHVNAASLIAPTADRQVVLDAIVRDNAGKAFAIVNHPNWNWRYGQADGQWSHAAPAKLLEWRGYAGIEIFNGVIGRLEGSPFALDRWDQLLSRGRRVWGFANDDSHAAEGDVALGWNMVYARERSVEGIVSAMAAGRFYASTGVVISDIAVRGDVIRIETENADRIVATGVGQRRFAVVDEKRIEVRVPGGDAYVRFECWGRGEQFAWTQPFFIVR